MFTSVTLAACGGGSGGGSDLQPQYSVFIDSTSTLVTTSIVSLYGLASCDECPPTDFAFGYCPPAQGPYESAIDIQWNNVTTGRSGSTIHGISGHCSCLFSYCYLSYSHRWSAVVPLAIGENEIELVALGPSKQPGTDTIVITRMPSAPTGVEAAATHGEITLHWNPVAEATSYTIEWSTEPDLELPGTHRVLGTQSPFVHTGLDDDTTYYYAVIAVSGATESRRSALVFATAGWIAQDLPMSAAAWQAGDTSIAIDANDRIHVHLSRRETVEFGVRLHNDYVTDSSGTWTSTPVGMPGYAYAADAEVAVDSHAVVYESHTDDSGVTCAKRPFATWNSVFHDSGAECHSSLALDALDKVHLVYVVLQTTPVVASVLRYASSASGAWETETLDATVTGCTLSNSTLSLDVEGDGTAHVAYQGPPPNSDVRYAMRQGGTWSYATIDPGSYRALSLALDVGGTPYVACCDYGTALHLARLESTGAWTIETIDQAGSSTSPSLVIDAAGKAHVSYYSTAEGGELRYATNASGSWRIAVIDAASETSTALALDSLGRAHVSYYRGSDPRYATNR